jgi:UDP-N-acetyl-D-mannosaminuronate dehydrogenase
VQKKGKTLVVGLGEVGGALAEVLERTGPVLKHDLEPRDFSDPVEVMHLCVPFTRQDQFEEIALSYIERFKPALTIINSTVLPGTTRAIAQRSGRPTAYCPVRGKHVRMVLDLLHYKKFVAACDLETARRAQEHFRQAAIQTERMDQPETLELAKLAETTYFGVLIAFAQEVNRYAGAVGADYEQAVRFFQEVDFLPHTPYFPGFIGGHCVSPNINLLRRIADSPLLEAVLDSNRRRAEELRWVERPHQAANGRP